MKKFLFDLLFGVSLMGALAFVLTLPVALRQDKQLTYLEASVRRLTTERDAAEERAGQAGLSAMKTAEMLELCGTERDKARADAAEQRRLMRGPVYWGVPGAAK